MKTKTFQGDLTAKGKKFAIVVSRFNSLISESLLSGALDCLERHGADSVDVIKVPGAFEIPFAARKAALAKKYTAPDRAPDAAPVRQRVARLAAQPAGR